jgi:hypothetical protein
MSTLPEGIQILKATYGSDQHIEEVTSAVKALIVNGSLSITVSPQAFGIIDPAPGIKKTLQVNASINGGAPTLFVAEDTNQLVINAPTVKEDAGPKSLNSQLTTVGWYAVISLASAFFASSSYQFGEKGLGSPILGKLFAIVIILVSVSFAVSDSDHSIFGLPVFIGSIALIQLGLAYFISLIYPDKINFNWTEIVQPVAEVPPTS